MRYIGRKTWVTGMMLSYFWGLIFFLTPYPQILFATLILTPLLYVWIFSIDDERVVS